jgi:hypothetical protein
MANIFMDRHPRRHHHDARHLRPQVRRPRSRLLEADHQPACRTAQSEDAVVAFIWAWSSALDKEGLTRLKSVLVFNLDGRRLMLIYLPFMFRAKRWAIIGKDQAWVRLLPLGLMNTLRAWCQFTSVTLILVPYAIGLKRLSIFFGLLWAYWIFKEKTPDPVSSQPL